MSKSLFLLTIVLSLGAVQEASGQTPKYSVVLRDVALAEALEHFVDLTGASIAYDPKLVTASERVFCVVQTSETEELLSCVLRETSLDFLRLSSGTYSVTRKVERRPAFGRLAGQINDLATGNPVAYAHISIPGTRTATASNVAGQFVLPPLLPGPYTLRVTHVNYGTYEQQVVINSDGRDHVEVSMNARPVLFAPVVVDGAGRRMGADRVQAGRAAALEDMPGGSTSLDRRITTVPGVRVNDITADAYIQAGEPGEQQMRLDGVPIFLPRHIIGLYGAFSPFSIGSLTVHRAGFGADVGSQIAGVIDARHLIGKGRSVDVQADPMSLNGRFEFDIGRNGRRDVITSVSARVRNDYAWTPPWITRFLTSWSRPDEFLMTAPLRYQIGLANTVTPMLSFERRPDPQFTFNDLHFASRIHVSPLRSLYLSGYRGEQRLGGRLSHRTSVMQPDYRQNWISVEDEYQWSNAAVQGTYSMILGSRSLLAVQLRFSDYDHRYRHLLMENLFLSTGARHEAAAGISSYPARDKNYVREIGARATLDYVISGHYLDAGVEVTRTASGFDFFISDAPQVRENVVDNEFHFSSQHVLVDHDYRAWRIAAFAQDQIAVGTNAQLTLGMRLTYLPETGAAYAEPRTALTFSGRNAAVGEWSLNTRAGIYRQFVSQHDVSSLDAGALLPTLRIWLPLDASVRPPVAYHLAQGMSIRPVEWLEIGADSYGRVQPHALLINYGIAAEADQQPRLSRQSDIMGTSRIVAAGGSLTASADVDLFKASGGYEYSFISRRSDIVFDGRWETVPWNEPHRVHLSADFVPSDRALVGLRWRASAGRTWAFRQAYYDYFSGSHEYASMSPEDFSRPSDHILPARNQLDLTAAYRVGIAGADLQVRLEILNVLNHKNVEEWRLREVEGGFAVTPHLAYGRLPSAAIRLNW